MSGGVSRVTIVAPHSRVDLALPSDVPLADLLPTLLSFTGVSVTAPAPAVGNGRAAAVSGNGRAVAAGGDEASRNGWALSRLGSGELDTSRTPSQLDVRDGELLYLRPRGEDAPAAIYDDLVDALATGSRDRRGQWSPAAARTAGLAAGVVALVAGAVAVPFAGPPYGIGGIIGLGLAVALLVVAAVFARALGDARTGAAFAVVATVYAAVGGLLALVTTPTLAGLTNAHIIVAATAATVAATLASLAAPGAARVFLCAGLVSVAALITMAVASWFGIAIAAAAAVTVCLAYATLPVQPMLAYRLSGLPVPAVPAEPESVRQDAEDVDGAVVLARSRRADGYLSAMVAALAVISAVSAVLLSLTGAAGRWLALVLGLLPVLRARWFVGLAPRLALLLSGAVALGADAVVEFRLIDQASRLVVIFAVAIGVAAISVGVGLISGGRAGSPVWGRALDVLEVLLILALIPLAVLVSGLYGWIRAVRG
jgi:type VII secretion integral membrane protein EccD